MKRIFLVLIVSAFFFSCQKKDSSSSPEQPSISHRECATYEAVQLAIAADPGVGKRMQEVEAFINRAISNNEVAKRAGSTIVIPLVIHVLYNTNEENISDAQVQSQVDVLNEDFNLRNSDVDMVPQLFASRVADVGIKFVLNKVIRKHTNKKSWAANDNMKFDQTGGSDTFDPEHNLNIWVCNLQKYLGYSYYPGIVPQLDGVVCLYSAFGRTGTLIPSYNKGRTTTHEVGHYLNLIHIWGDARCGDDRVDDTPLHDSPNFNCPAYPHYSTCTGTPVEMTMNYMDYTDDACMFMFSRGQKTRMLALFVSGGPRDGFVQ